MKPLDRDAIEEDLFYLIDEFTNEGWDFKILKEEMKKGSDLFKKNCSTILVGKWSRPNSPEVIEIFVVKNETSKEALIDAVSAVYKIRNEFEKIQETKIAINKIIENVTPEKKEAK
jgi:hypothetical protein